MPTSKSSSPVSYTHLDVYKRQGATFLRIKAQREGKLLTYDVYLGENNTTNFDVQMCIRDRGWTAWAM